MFKLMKLRKKNRKLKRELVHKHNEKFYESYKDTCYVCKYYKKEWDGGIGRYDKCLAKYPLFHVYKPCPDQMLAKKYRDFKED